MSDKNLEIIAIDFHGLMDLIGCYSEDRFSKKWSFGIQPKDEYFDVNQNEDGTFTIQGNPKAFADLKIIRKE